MAENVNNQNTENDPTIELINYIRNQLKPAALFEQLAEECIELAHCAQKQARLMRNENPIDSDLVELVKDTDEELADVFVALNTVGLQPNQNLMYAKLDRWAGRLQAMSSQKQQMEMPHMADGEDGDPEPRPENESVPAEVIE